MGKERSLKRKSVKLLELPQRHLPKRKKKERTSSTSSKPKTADEYVALIQEKPNNKIQSHRASTASSNSFSVSEQDGISRSFNEDVSAVTVCSSRLPEGFCVGKAISRGDCFFDSVAQGFKQIGFETDVKSLRKVCREFAQDNQQLKAQVIEDAKSPYSQTIRLPDSSISDDELWEAYLNTIEYTADDVKKIKVNNPDLYSSLHDLKYGNTLQAPIWGRSSIEGQVICQKYDVKLHVIENVKSTIVTERWVHEATDKTGAKSVENYTDEHYNKSNVIHVVNKGSGHFEPVLRRITDEPNGSATKKKLQARQQSSMTCLSRSLHPSTRTASNSSFAESEQDQSSFNEWIDEREMDIYNEDSEFPHDLQDGSRQDLRHERHNADQTNQYRNYFPHNLIGLMYRLDLSVLCSLRESMYKNKYPSLSLVFGDSEIDKFNDIVFRYEKRSIHIQIENVDKYYTDNDISYARLFTKEKRSFSTNNYFDSFVKHLITKSGSLSNNMKYLIVCTNSGLDLTEENNLREGKFKKFYPFKFDRINLEECALIKDFLFTNDNKQESGFYKFSRDKTTKEELLMRLEFSSTMQKVIKERKISREFEKEMKEAFLDKLVFAVNQPNREELNSIIKNEIENNCTVEDDYVTSQEKILQDLTAPEKDKKLKNYVSGIMYAFNLLMLFLHDMFLYKNIFSINFEGKSHDISSNIVLDYKGKITYVKDHNANCNIGYSQLFPSRQQKEKNMFSINKYFTLFVEELRESIEYFIIYTNTDLDLMEEKVLKKGQSKDFYPFKFDSIDIQKKRYKVFRYCSCIDKNGLYRFSKEEATRKKLLSLLKLPPSLKKEKDEGRLFNENDQEVKETFLNKLIFATNQPNRQELNNIVKDKIDKSDVPYNYEELHEIALRWSESHEFGPLTKGIMEKFLGDIKDNRSSYKKIQSKNINKEIKFARSVVGREGIPAFNQFLHFLIKGEGIKCLEVLKRGGVDLARMSSILHVAGANAAKAFKDLYDLWFDKQGNKTQYLKSLEKEEIHLSNMSSILGGAGTNAAKAFKDLYDLWLDVEGSKTQCLKTLEKEGIDLARMSSILSGAGANAAKVFKDLYNLWFNEQGNKTQYLKVLEKEGINLSNMSSILNVAGANAAKVFKDLYDLWFDMEGSKTQYLKTLEKGEINLSNMSSILSGAGANAAKVFKDLYDLWFDEEGSKTQYLKTLEKEGINLANMSSILNGAGINAAKAFKDLYDLWFDAKGNKKLHLKHFIEDKDRKKSFTLHNLSGILSRAGANAKDAFEKLYNVCFSGEGNRTELLNDFYKAGFTPSNLSCTLCGAGARASFTLKRLHSTCFNEKREKTKYLDNFYKTGFRPCDLCGVLSAAADSLKKFHDFCFKGETKKNLNHFLIEEEGFLPKNLSKILHGAGANICSVLKDFHDVCFDEQGNKTQLLDDFYEAGFTPSDLSNILSMAGNNSSSNLRKFHKSCFSKKKYLNHFLAVKNPFTPKVLSKILYGAGTKICPTFKKLHDLCFDKAGNKTNYLNNLIEYNQGKIVYILHKKIRRATSTFLDEHNTSKKKGSKRSNAGPKPSNSSSRTEHN